MGRTSRRHSRFRLLRSLTAGLWAVGAPLISTGCAGVGATVTVHSSTPAPAVPAAPPATPPAPYAQSQWHPAVHTVDAEKPHELPITLDTVLRLAEEHNPRIGLAREKVHESLLKQEENCRSWLP